MRASTPKAVSEPKTPGTGPAFRLPFDNSFFRDMQGFYVPWKPEPSPAPAWVQFNDALALELGLEPATLKSATGLAWLSGVEMPAEAAPLAQAYAGHQFGQFSPHLGMAAPCCSGNSSTRQDSVGTWPSGVGPYAVFAPWRWQGGTGPGAARVPHGRGHARVGHSHDACAGGDPDR